MSKELKTPAKLMSQSITALVLGCAFAASTQAAVLIPEKGGFSGHLNLGVGGVDVESNMIASIANGKIDITDEKINDINGSPDGQTTAIPVVNLELSYTFENSRTQLHIGNLLEDYLRFDTNTVAGVRQDVGRAGLVGASYRTTTLKTEVWKDPYVTGVDRDTTDRESKGFRVYWQQVMSSGLELRYTQSEVDIDDEFSGSALGLPSAQSRLLDRNGDRTRYDAFYEFSWDDDRHILTPEFSYIDNDMDGAAMENDGFSTGFNYIYTANKTWRWVFNATYTDLSYDTTNPIYGKKDGSTAYGLSGTVFYSKPFGWEKWAFNATAGFFDADHDIDFYDNSVGIVAVGMFRKF